MSQSKANKPCDQNAQGQSGGSFTGGAGNSNNGGQAGT